jgi:glycosyltransferase involved in cell wall biosynthesis
MRLLIVTPLLPPESGAPSYYAVGLKEALEKAGHAVDVIAFREVRKYPTGIRHLLFLYLVLWRGFRADAFIILDTVSVALPAVIAGWFLFKKMIIRTGGDFVWEHYVERTKEKVLLSEFYLPTDGNPRKLSFKENSLIFIQKHIIFSLAQKIAISTEWQRGIWTKPYGIPDDKTFILEHIFPTKTSPAPGGDKFLCAWRPTAFKNVTTLERAYDLLKETLSDKDQTMPSLEMLKNVPREHFYERLKHARALIVPSLSETGPIIALESLAMGVPVILTQDCGMRYRYKDSVMYIDPKDPENIRDAMLRMMDDETYQQYKTKAIAFSYKYTYDDVAQEFLKAISFIK